MNAVRESLMDREKGKLAALSKDLDGRDMSMVGTRIANGVTRQSERRLLGNAYHVVVLDLLP